MKCNPETPCDMVRVSKKRVEAQQDAAWKASAANAKAKKGKTPAPPPPEEVEYGTPEEAAETTPKKRRKANPVVVSNNPSIPLAMHARGQLEPLGWALTGKAWFDEDDGVGWAEVSGKRGVELIHLWFRDGQLHSSDYTLWDAAKESTNGRPKSRLPFNPDEMSDAELAAALRNRKVTWWNRIGKSRETAVVGEKFKIENNFNYKSNEDDEGEEYLRIVTFVDKHGGGFRSFNVHALLKVD